VPYGTIEDLRSSGLGVINETDAWLTGRPYGLPGTAVVKLTRHAPLGAKMVGGFGDADTANVALQLQQMSQVQAQQQASLKRIAFWQMLTGAIGVASVTAIVAGAIYSAVKERR
jgi:hypothetical protein